MKRVQDLSRNDLTGAVAVYRDGLRRGTWTPEQAEMLVMLQDDPNPLLAEIARVNREMPGAVERVASVLDEGDPDVRRSRR